MVASFPNKLLEKGLQRCSSRDVVNVRLWIGDNAYPFLYRTGSEMNDKQATDFLLPYIYAITPASLIRSLTFSL